MGSSVISQAPHINSDCSPKSKIAHLFLKISSRNFYRKKKGTLTKIVKRNYIKEKMVNEWYFRDTSLEDGDSGVQVDERTEHTALRSFHHSFRGYSLSACVSQACAGLWV